MDAPFRKRDPCCKSNISPLSLSSAISMRTMSVEIPWKWFISQKFDWLSFLFFTYLCEKSESDGHAYLARADDGDPVARYWGLIGQFGHQGVFSGHIYWKFRTQIKTKLSTWHTWKQCLGNTSMSILYWVNCTFDIRLNTGCKYLFKYTYLEVCTIEWRAKSM